MPHIDPAKQVAVVPVPELMRWLTALAKRDRAAGRISHAAGVLRVQSKIERELRKMLV